MGRYSRNAVCIAFVLLMAWPCAAYGPEEAFETPAAEKTGAIKGRFVLKGGGPLEGVRVMFYEAAVGPPPSPEYYDRSPDFTVETDSEGRFSAELQTGKYYMAAIKHLSGGRMGHPRDNDYLYRNLDEAGRQKEYLIKGGETIDLGALEAVLMTANIFKGRLSNRSITTSIEGTVTNANGIPVEGAVVIAFFKIVLKERGKPVFLSDQTDKAGHYVLRVLPGAYYLKARSSSASGPPKKGEIIGFYGMEEPGQVTVGEGEKKKGIDLIVKPFEGKKPPIGPLRPEE
jgi:hypothetical protein